MYSLLEGDNSAECRIVVECIARTLKSAHSRIINSQLILQRRRRQLEFKQNNKFYLNFALRRLLPSALILKQLEFEQNIRFYLNLTQYRMYPFATLQNERRIFHFARCRMSHSGLILDRFSWLQNAIKIFNCMLYRIHRPLSRVRQRIRHSPRQRQYFFLFFLLSYYTSKKNHTGRR